MLHLYPLHTHAHQKFLFSNRNKSIFNENHTDRTPEKKEKKHTTDTIRHLIWGNGCYQMLPINEPEKWPGSQNIQRHMQMQRVGAAKFRKISETKTYVVSHLVYGKLLRFSCFPPIFGHITLFWQRTHLSYALT